MKEYCVDLEIAKELQEKGFPQNSNYSYGKYLKRDGYGFDLSTVWESVIEPFMYSAPISDEILKELPKEYKKYGFAIHLITHTYKSELDYYSAGYYDYHEPYFIGSDKKLSNALAKIWLSLKKEGYIK